MKSLRVRTESRDDYQIAESIHDIAFGSPNESLLVRLLRKSDAFVPELSILAEYDDEIVGHILFTKIHLTENGKNLDCLSLAPVAVLPKFQRRGIGTALIEEGIERGRSLGFSSILVLGDQAYYGKFGFHHDLTTKIESAYSCKDFAGLELKAGALSKILLAKAIYPPAFSAVD